VHRCSRSYSKRHANTDEDSAIPQIRKRLTHYIHATQSTHFISAQPLTHSSHIHHGGAPNPTISNNIPHDGHQWPQHPPLPLLLLQQRKAQAYLTDCDTDTNNNQDNDDPRDGTHLRIGNGVGKNLSEVEKDAAALVEDLDAGGYLEVFADREVEGVERGFGVPEEVGDVEDVRCWVVVLVWYNMKKRKRGGRGRSGLTEVDVYATFEESAEDLDDFFS
jgi:hypothetical protein